jgi:hypothetical protein
MPDIRDPHDELVGLVGRLPLHDLDPTLARRVRERAHARLARAQRTRRVVPPFVITFGRVLEPALAGLLAVANLTWAVLSYLRVLL